jgi:hypothetical protein
MDIHIISSNSKWLGLGTSGTMYLQASYLTLYGLRQFMCSIPLTITIRLPFYDLIVLNIIRLTIGYIASIRNNLDSHSWVFYILANNFPSSVSIIVIL